jgi:hypothetical protein
MTILYKHSTVARCFTIYFANVLRLILFHFIFDTFTHEARGAISKTRSTSANDDKERFLAATKHEGTSN